jgi:hypothetical protein
MKMADDGNERRDLSELARSFTAFSLLFALMRL